MHALLVFCYYYLPSAERAAEDKQSQIIYLELWLMKELDSGLLNGYRVHAFYHSIKLPPKMIGL